MRFASAFPAAFALMAFVPAPSAAHDAPMVLIEAIEAHLLDCPNANGAMPGGDMLSQGWEQFTSDDALLTTRVEEFVGDAPAHLRNVNLYRKEVEGLELIQMMGVRSLLVESFEGDQNIRNDISPTDFAATEFECITMVPDLPFMPSGRLLSAVFGKDASTGIENTPGDTRTGAWVWEDISPTHLTTLASYTDAESAKRLLPDRIFYRGFYVSSLYRFTPDQPTSDQPTEESDQP